MTAGGNLHLQLLGRASLPLLLKSTRLVWEMPAKASSEEGLYVFGKVVRGNDPVREFHGEAKRGDDHRKVSLRVTVRCVIIIITR